MEPGIYDDIPNEEYHGGPGVSKSGLDLVAVSPLHYLAAVTRSEDPTMPPRQPTPAQRFGTAFHSMLLEPADFARSYTLPLRMQEAQDSLPAGAKIAQDRDQLVTMVGELNKGRKAKIPTGGTKGDLIARLIAEVGAEGWTTPLEEMSLTQLKACIVGHNESRPGLLSTTGTMPELAALLRVEGVDVRLWSEIKAAWAQGNAHKTVLDDDEWAQLQRMRDAVHAHPAARRLLEKPGVAERSVYWRDPVTGVLCRCRPDFWTDDNIVVDLKTCEDASPEGFAHSIRKWRYYVQDPYYCDGIAQATGAKPRAFLFLAVEKSARVVNGKALGVAVYQLDPDSVAAGRMEYRRNLDTYAECVETQQWPGYGDKIAPIALDPWFLARAAAEANQ